MTFIDFFAGIGGFRRGMELEGHKCVGFCEWDKYATASYTSMHLITDEQRECLSKMNKKNRFNEILKEEYRNGEWYAADIRSVVDVPRADCWCFGAPCQDFSIAGQRAGLDGERSSLVGEIFRLLRGLAESDRPEWLVYENVTGMLSSNGGFDYAWILAEMDECGYDAQWQNLNSKEWGGVPQNRERIYTIGHFRTFGRKEVLPLKGDGEQNCVDIRQVGMAEYDRKNPNQYRVYDPGGDSPALNSMNGGGRQPFTIMPLNSKGGEANTQPSMKDRVYYAGGCGCAVATSDFFNPNYAIPMAQAEDEEQ